GIEIGFARTSFKWRNTARDGASVTCVIVGLRNASNAPKRLFTGDGERVVENINPYLSAAPDVIVEKKDASICGLPEMRWGNKASDGLNLILTPNEAAAIVEEWPEAASVVRRYIGSREYINGIERYCLWMTAGDYENLRHIPEIHRRVEAVREFRLRSVAESTRERAATQWAFIATRHQEKPALLIPATSSERREYIPMGYIPRGWVASSSAFVIYDAPLWLFAVLTSKMHMVWQRAVCGYLKSNLRYSSVLCYNTFPFPRIKKENYAALEVLGRRILAARENYHGWTPAELYDPDKMPVDLLVMHRHLDSVVDELYRPCGFKNDDERRSALFDMYCETTRVARLF
ncbi:MAG: hypothetical protein HUK22_00635, partial [Thermoguttaceae bacterium]|nr:hypothetical protein [Thermoguttaceae bacterium]